MRRHHAVVLFSLHEKKKAYFLEFSTVSVTKAMLGGALRVVLYAYSLS